MGGELRVGCPVDGSRAALQGRSYRLRTRRGVVAARAGRRRRAGRPDRAARAAGRGGGACSLTSAATPPRRAGACVVFLGVPEDEVAGQSFTHHQLLHDYDAAAGQRQQHVRLGVGARRHESAPAGLPRRDDLDALRAGDWQGLSTEPNTRRQKRQAGRAAGRRWRGGSIPDLGRRAVVCEVGDAANLRALHAPAARRRRRRPADPRQRQPARDAARPGRPRLLAGRRHAPGRAWGRSPACLGSRIVGRRRPREAGRRGRHPLPTFLGRPSLNGGPCPCPTPAARR